MYVNSSLSCKFMGEFKDKGEVFPTVFVYGLCTDFMLKYGNWQALSSVNLKIDSKLFNSEVQYKWR